MDNVLILLKDIDKLYSRRLVLDNLQFTLHSGDAVALIGVNGSGKSTLLRIVAGLARADRGTREVNLNGSKVIGYVAERFPR